MAYQTVKVSKTLLDRFRSACAVRGDHVNTVLREAMEQYVSETPNAETIAAMEEVDEMIRTGSGQHFEGSAEAFFDMLDAEDNGDDAEDASP